MRENVNHKESRPGLHSVLGVLAVALLIVCAGSVYLYVTIFAVDAASFEQGQARAEGLLVALEQYRQDTGAYPRTMESLVPDYLSAMPRPARRYEYLYKVCANGTGYILYFRLAGANDEWCGYGTGTKEWKCTDSIPPYYYDMPCDD